MRVGVVAHRGYDGLAEVLRRLTELARRLDLRLAFEPELRALSRRPIKPSRNELAANQRASSARLRAAVKPGGEE